MIKKYPNEMAGVCESVFLDLGEKYNVNPYIFGGIYIGAIPLFFLCLSWTIRNIRKKFAIPLLLTGLCFVSAYLYLIVVGKNIPTWVYVFIGVMVVYGVYSIIKTIKKKVKTPRREMKFIC